MKSPKIFTHKRTYSRGFTLLEMLIVMAIITMLSGFTLVVSMDSYRGYAFRNERDTLVATLQKARSQSINNMCLGTGCTDGRPHGVHLLPGQYIIFQGTDYATRDSGVDELIQATYGAASFAPTSLTDVVFTQLSADVAIPGDITIQDDAAHNSVISINSEGRISWTH